MREIERGTNTLVKATHETQAQVREHAAHMLRTTEAAVAAVQQGPGTASQHERESFFGLRLTTQGRFERDVFTNKRDEIYGVVLANEAKRQRTCGFARKVGCS